MSDSMDMYELIQEAMHLIQGHAKHAREVELHALEVDYKGSSYVTIGKNCLEANTKLLALFKSKAEDIKKELDEFRDDLKREATAQEDPGQAAASSSAGEQQHAVEEEARDLESSSGELDSGRDMDLLNEAVRRWTILDDTERAAVVQKPAQAAPQLSFSVQKRQHGLEEGKSSCGIS